MQKKEIVPELLVVRSIACMAVVLLHAISMVLQYHPSLPPESRRPLTIVSMLLLFSTPTFAFMSAFLIGHSKQQRSAVQSWLKRVQYLLVPFLFFALFYAVWGSYNWGFPVYERLLYNLRGGYHGYFVLVVMQFYLAHALLGPLLAKLSPLFAVAGAGIVNVGYLAALNLNWYSPPPSDFSWYHLLPAWCFYYVLGFYAGRDREAFQDALGRRLPLGLALLASSALVLLHLTTSGFLPNPSSQRFDVPLYVAGVICVFFPLAGRIRRVPALLNKISRASFGVYLLHWFFLELFWRAAHRYLDMPPAVPILALWVASMVCSVAVTNVLNRWTWGAYLVGKLGVNGRARSQGPSLRKQRPPNQRIAGATD